MRSDNLVFAIVEEALHRKINPIDKELIERHLELEEFCLTVPADMNILRYAEYFCKNQDHYYMVQLGEFLSYKNLELDKPFVAYTRDPVGRCVLSGNAIHEMVAYRP